MIKSSKSVNYNAALTGIATRACRTAPCSRAPAPRPWGDLLSEALETQILPRLLSKTQSQKANSGVALHPPATIEEAVVAEFVELLIADDMEQLLAIADRIILQTGSREALFETLLTPAAQLLGQMWEQDTADFVTVTLCVYRLDRIMNETSSQGHAAGPAQAAHACECRILLLPVPGEQHGFGLAMVADAFREGGWCVRTGPAVARAKLLTLVRDEWFDVIGFTVSSERWLKNLPSCIRDMRAASCNRNAFVMAGGQAIANQPERTRFLGIDATAQDAWQALARANLFMANIFMERSVTASLQQSKSKITGLGRISKG